MVNPQKFDFYGIVGGSQNLRVHHLSQLLDKLIYGTKQPSFWEVTGPPAV